MVEVTVPLLLEGSLTFEVESDEEVTPDYLARKLIVTQRMIDRGDMSGIYVTILGASGSPQYEDMP